MLFTDLLIMVATALKIVSEYQVLNKLQMYHLEAV